MQKLLSIVLSLALLCACFSGLVMAAEADLVENELIEQEVVSSEAEVSEEAPAEEEALPEEALAEEEALEEEAENLEEELSAALEKVNTAFGSSDSEVLTAETIGGNCGTNANWSLDTNTGVLEIFTATADPGQMSDYKIGNPKPPWNSYQNKIKEVKIENGITYIGNYAFYYYTNLTKVSLPESLDTIGQSVFQNCSFTEVILPTNLTSIKDNAFEYCNSLKEITLPESLNSIGAYAFDVCSSLTKVTVLNKAMTFGNSSIPQAAVIYGYTDSTAQAYAASNGNEFVALDIIAGDCGTNAQFSLNTTTGLLTIEVKAPGSSGHMADYSSN
ncbi:MAG: leucine-rich repeat domain-containing protein, partial [Clostridia bacterium]|nr:leucine-rich repeat domain-containing protein [Clostridia bacterium]